MLENLGKGGIVNGTFYSRQLRWCLGMVWGFFRFTCISTFNCPFVSLLHSAKFRHPVQLCSFVAISFLPSTFQIPLPNPLYYVHYVLDSLWPSGKSPTLPRAFMTLSCRSQWCPNSRLTLLSCSCSIFTPSYSTLFCFVIGLCFFSGTMTILFLSLIWFPSPCNRTQIPYCLANYIPHSTRTSSFKQLWTTAVNALAAFSGRHRRLLLLRFALVDRSKILVPAMMCSMLVSGLHRSGLPFAFLWY